MKANKIDNENIHKFLKKLAKLEEKYNVKLQYSLDGNSFDGLSILDTETGSSYYPDVVKRDSSRVKVYAIDYVAERKLYEDSINYEKQCLELAEKQREHIAKIDGYSTLCEAPVKHNDNKKGE